VHRFMTGLDMISKSLIHMLFHIRQSGSVTDYVDHFSYFD
jgi:hypothetical protein